MMRRSAAHKQSQLEVIQETPRSDRSPENSEEYENDLHIDALLKSGDRGQRRVSYKMDKMSESPMIIVEEKDSNHNSLPGFNATYTLHKETY